MKTKKFVSALLASAVALSLVAGCGGGDKKKADEKKPAAAAGAVKVGVFLPLTGDNAAGGELELRGIKLANKLHPEINGKKIELVIADNKSDKAESANVVARLIEKDKVKVILGSYGSSLSMAAGNIVKDSKVPAKRQQGSGHRHQLHQPSGYQRQRVLLPRLLHRSVPGHRYG